MHILTTCNNGQDIREKNRDGAGELTIIKQELIKKYFGKKEMDKFIIKMIG